MWKLPCSTATAATGAERSCADYRGRPTFRSVTFLNGEADIRPTIEQQKALFVMVFDEEFSRRVDAGAPAQMQVIFDGRRSNAAQIASYYLETIVRGIGESTPRGHTALNSSTGAADGAPRLDVRVRCWFNPNLEFQWFFLPNLIGMLSFMLGLVVTGLSVAREREVGTFDQLLVSPATPTEIALAKLVPGCLVGLVHGTIFLLISVFDFGVPFTGLVLLYVHMLVFAMASGGGVDMLSLSATQQQAFKSLPQVLWHLYFRRGYARHQHAAISQYASQLNSHAAFYHHCAGRFFSKILPWRRQRSLGKIACISAVAVSVAVWMFKRKA